MPTRIEVNVITGEITEHELTAEEIAALPIPELVTKPDPIVDPVDKLKQFLASNPDVASLLNNKT